MMEVEIGSPRAVVMNLDTGEILYAKAAEEPVAVASLTKVMTVYLAAKAATDGERSLDEMVTITPEMVAVMPEFVVAGLMVGQQVSYQDLLYLTLLPSNADAAQALAVAVSGSIEKFVENMNSTAKDWGMLDTNFSNVAGYDEVGGVKNYSTAHDVAVMIERGRENEMFRQVFETREYVAGTLGIDLKATTLATAEKYGMDIAIITGAKTGFTNLAGRCLGSTGVLVPEDGSRAANLAVVTLGGGGEAGHLADTLALYDFYAANYQYREVTEPGKTLARAKVVDGSVGEVVIAEREAEEVYLPKITEVEVGFEPGEVLETGDEGEYILRYPGGLGWRIVGKMEVGELLGTAMYKNGEEVILTVEERLEEEIMFYNYPVIFGLVSVVMMAVIAIILKCRKVGRR